MQKLAREFSHGQDFNLDFNSDLRMIIALYKDDLLTQKKLMVTLNLELKSIT